MLHSLGLKTNLNSWSVCMSMHYLKFRTHLLAHSFNM